MIQFVNPETLAARTTHSQLASVNSFVWMSGQTSLDHEGRIVGTGDAERQTIQIWSNIERGLAAVGLSLDDVVNTRVFVDDIAHLAAVNRGREAVFRDGRLRKYPASTLCIVAGLARPEFLVEIDVVAWKDDA